MGVRRNGASPLIHAELFQLGFVNGVTFWDKTQPPEVAPESTDQTYIIEMADRHDLLAFRRMGASHLGWVIMERNKDIEPEEIDMRLWPNDFVPGRPIKIPSRESIRRRGVAP